MTFPWPESWVVFLVALWPAQLLGVIWHEAGHMLAGRAAGLRVLAWGMGLKQPWFHWRHGRTVFYLALPTSLGLTIYCRKLLEREPKPEFLFILGGPLASALGLLAGLAAWWWGARSDLLVAWIAASSILTLTSAIPFSFHSGPLRLENDARQLIDLAVHGPATRPQPLGAALSNLQTLAELMTKIGADYAAGYFRIAAGTVDAALGNFAAADEEITSGELLDAGEIDAAPRLAAFARAVIAVEQNTDHAFARLDSADALCADDATARFMLDCLREEYRVNRGADISQRIEELHARATLATRRDWLTTAALLRFETIADDDPEHQCREFIKQNERFLTPEGRARTLAVTTQRLATRGDHGRARSLFAESQRAIAEAASTIANPATKESYLKRAAAPLQRAVAATEDAVPLFLADAPWVSTKRNDVFARGAALAGACSLAAAVASVYLDTSRDVPLNAAQAAGCFGFIVLCLFTVVICAFFSVSRSERAWAKLGWGLIVALAAVALGVAADLPIRKRPPAWAQPQLEPLLDDEPHFDDETDPSRL